MAGLVGLMRDAECDKSFTRSDALAKHMRTVHEPDPTRLPEHTPSTKGKSGVKLRLTNGSASSKAAQVAADAATAPTVDEDGNPIEPSPASDNITYIPAHHPITGQPGFMIHYPPDIQFTHWESAIPADELMRLLRRQLLWAQREQDELKKETEALDRIRREEWTLKEILLEGVMESELARADRLGFLDSVDDDIINEMERDVDPSRNTPWIGPKPTWRRRGKSPINEVAMAEASTPVRPEDGTNQHSPSPPDTGKSGGFDGDNDPYDNYLAGRMAEYEQRERMRSMQSTPQKAAAKEREFAEADAVGALMGMSGGVK